MDETLTIDLTLPVSVSGNFICLYNEGRLHQLMQVWTTSCALSAQLEQIRTELRLCNDPAWLCHFYKNCEKRKQDFAAELEALTKRLEFKRVNLEPQLEQLRQELERVEPSLFKTAHTLVGPWPPIIHSYRREQPKRGPGPLVAARNAVIAKCVALPALEICRKLDGQDHPIPVPESWKEEFRGAADTWVKAYLLPGCMNRVHRLISGARRKPRLP
jgi:hypothetical protein